MRLVLASAGGGFLGQVNQGTAYVRLVPHGERTITFARIWHGLVSGDPLAGFRGNWSQRDVMQEVRRRLARIPDLRFTVRNAPSFNIGGGSFDIDFVIRGPGPHRRSPGTARPCGSGPGRSGASPTRTPRSSSTSRSCASRSTARGPPIWAWTPSRSRRLFALMVGGDQEVSRFLDPTVNDDYDVQLRLAESDRRDPGTIARLYVPRQNGSGLVRLDSVVKIVPAEAASRIDRSTGSARTGSGPRSCPASARPTGSRPCGARSRR